MEEINNPSECSTSQLVQWIDELSLPTEIFNGYYICQYCNILNNNLTRYLRHLNLYHEKCLIFLLYVL